MPRQRQPRSVWNKTRRKVWERDKGKCVHCKKEVSLKECHIDHITSGKKGSNNMENLRTLCPKCHVLRRDFRHRGMTARALKKGLIPANWRKLTW
ncbi:HNH endonuclease [Clostridium sp. ZS2-4]|uniref:HNH endonuclease n=1 Tax=Clostridium sp. ZS2-4 TaxID=2987703 RepID=UPI00227D16B2|nr:HNH endonuclease signature motif containing protein [Clostridium sp. ZS2-4]MCY6354346.1 HNH endonuclease signature motif containing protein [Clostridium sp. ZS2-4]